MHEVLRRRATTRKKTGLVPSPQNYSDILHSAENVKRNLKDKLFRLGRDPLVPIWRDVKPIKIITVGLVQGYLPSEAGKEPQKIEDFTLFNSSQTCFPVEYMSRLTNYLDGAFSLFLPDTDTQTHRQTHTHTHTHTHNGVAAGFLA